MEKTVVFYGRYSATHLDGALSNYDLKLAYMLVIIAYFVISLIYMVHQYVLYQCGSLGLSDAAVMYK